MAKNTIQRVKNERNAVKSYMERMTIWTKKPYSEKIFMKKRHLMKARPIIVSKINVVGIELLVSCGYLNCRNISMLNRKN